MTAPQEPFPAPVSDGVLTLRSTPDLLALIPYCLGHPPQESLVLLSLRPGPRGRGRSLGLTARVDIDAASRDQGVAQRLARHLDRDGATGVFVALYSSLSRESVEPLADRIQDAIDDAGIDLIDVILVAESSWTSLMCRDPHCCPVEQHPLTEVHASSVGPEMVFRGASLMADRSGRLAFLRQGDPQRVASVCARAWTTLRRGGPTATGFRRAFSTWKRLVAQAERAQESGHAAQRMSEFQASQLAAAMTDVRFRDALLVDAALDWPHGLADLLADLDLVAGVFDGARRPARHRIDAVREVLAEVVRSTEGELRADALAALSWIEWYTGDLAIARDVAEQAMDHNPGQSMAGLVCQLSEAGVPPGWTRRDAQEVRSA